MSTALITLRKHATMTPVLAGLLATILLASAIAASVSFLVQPLTGAASTNAGGQWVREKRTMHINKVATCCPITAVYRVMHVPTGMESAALTTAISARCNRGGSPSCTCS